MTPGVHVVDGRTYFQPTTPGALSSKAPGHMHVLRIQAYSLEGPLTAILGCRYCSKTTFVRANPLVRKMPDGFTEAAWRNFLDAAARRKSGDG